jgi:hypothetical protein
MDILKRYHRSEKPVTCRDELIPYNTTLFLYEEVLYCPPLYMQVFLANIVCALLMAIHATYNVRLIFFKFKTKIYVTEKRIIKAS